MVKRESLPIAKIYVPAKRRNTFDPAIVREIAESILEIGQQAPILVRQDGERFVLVDGLHRLEACKALGEETILASFVQSQHQYQRVFLPYEAAAETLRQKTARLRLLRLSKEAAETSSSAAPSTPLKQATISRNEKKGSRSSDSSSRSKPETLAEWLAQRERDGSRT